MKSDLQRTGSQVQKANLSDSLVRLTSGNTFELLKAKPIMMQVHEHGDDKVKNYIKAALIKMSNAIGDNLDANADRLDMLTTDLIEVYHYDSIEDITECLKKGRRGDYGFGHHKRGFITMLLLREWMSRHLEEKAVIREKEIARKKVDIKEVENFDAKKFYEEGAKFLNAQAEREKQKKNEGFNERHYEEHKLAYLQSRKDNERTSDGGEG